MSEIVTVLWRDPNSTFNSKEFQENRNRTGYGKVQYSSDGHLCFSNLEFTFDEWLISNKIEHHPHPKIPNSGRRADQLVNGYYIEIDGMGRNEEFWIEKYSGTDTNPLVISHKELDEESLKKILIQLGV